MASSRRAVPVPHDTVFFALFPDPPQQHTHQQKQPPPHTDAELLHGLRAECLRIALPLAHNYIWQHQPFDLSLSSPFSPCPCSPSSSPCPPHLHGKLKYGDNIDDEWFIVSILFAISRQLPALSIRIWDTDGEFLLIESAYWIPRWLKPENSINRVFIRQGFLHILPLPSTPAELYRLPVSPSITDALEVLSRGDLQTKAADPVQAALQSRIGSYGKDCKNNMHNVVCRVPLPVAQILKHEPQLVSLAVEAFYDRDLESMKAASRMQQFLPNGQVEMVDVMVRMSRAMYAQLMLQVFQAPRSYPMPSFSDPHHKEAELGMKLTCGFEMMYCNRSAYKAPSSDGQSDVPVQLGKLSSKDMGWQEFVASLQYTGYFRGLLEGSKEYRELMDAAVAHYRQTSLFSRVSTAMNAPIQRMKDILALPRSMQDFTSWQEMKSDDDSWLYTGEEDLRTAMLEREKEMNIYKSERSRRSKSHLYAGCDADSSKDKETTDGFNAKDVAESMHSFIDKISSFEGAEFPSDDDEPKVDDESVSIRMDNFLKELKSAFGSNAESLLSNKDKDLLEELDTSSSDMDFDDSESDIVDTMHSEDCMAQDLSSSSHRLHCDEEKEAQKCSRGAGDTAFMKEYSEALDRELHTSSLAKSFVQAENSLTVTDETKEMADSEEHLPPVNIDVNLLQNLLHSYSSQEGLPGPASNLLGAMGVHLPDDRSK